MILKYDHKTKDMDFHSTSDCGQGISQVTTE